ncbi:MAG: metallophosphoesterase family protein [Candidatus Odinarchaeia archaeon]
MVTFAHLGDTHLGFRLKHNFKDCWKEHNKVRWVENDFYEAWNFILNEISNRRDEIDFIVHTGDLYDLPQSMNPHPPPESARCFLTKSLKQFFAENKIPIIIIDGNHGVYQTYEYSLLDTLKQAFSLVKGVTVWDLRKSLREMKPLTLDFKDVRFYLYPYFEYATLRAYSEIYRKWVVECQAPKRDKTEVAVVHGADFDDTLHPRILEHEYDYVALGHDHGMKKINKNAWYSGSTERWSFKERNQRKGFLIVSCEKDEKPDVKVINIPIKRPMEELDIEITPNSTAQSVLITLERLLMKYKTDKWRGETAARVKLRFKGSTPLDAFWAIEDTLIGFMQEIFQRETHNIIQFFWDTANLRKTSPKNVPKSKELIDVLIEDPEKEFSKFLETMDIEEGYDRELLSTLAADIIRKVFSE